MKDHLFIRLAIGINKIKYITTTKIKSGMWNIDWKEHKMMGRKVNKNVQEYNNYQIRE